MDIFGVGNADEARVALESCLHKYAPKYLPSGWKYLGSGIDRAAYLSPTSVVYKVMHYPGSANKDEYNATVFFREQPNVPEGFAIPRCSLYRVNGNNVIAMEYLGEERYQPTPEEQLTIAKFFHVFDSHGGNVRKRLDKVYVIDYGNVTSERLKPRQPLLRRLVGAR